MDRDFTLDKYSSLCESISASNYISYTVEEVIDKKQKLVEPFIILRHDVDRSPKNAYKMAKIEKSNGIKATYYFRTVKSKLFDIGIINDIKNLDHEIGYHYEVLSSSKGDFDRAIKLFKNSVDKFNDIGVSVKTASFHGSPFSKFDNRNFWSKNKFTDFGLIGLAYDSIDFSDIFYVTDTGRTFSQTRGNLRDKPLTKFLIDPDINSTNDLINFIRMQKGNLYITTHPVRWSSGILDWSWEFLFQNTKNIGKYFLNYARN